MTLSASATRKAPRNQYGKARAAATVGWGSIAPAVNSAIIAAPTPAMNQMRSIPPTQPHTPTAAATRIMSSAAVDKGKDVVNMARDPVFRSVWIADGRDEPGVRRPHLQDH